MERQYGKKGWDTQLHGDVTDLIRSEGGEGDVVRLRSMLAKRMRSSAHLASCARSRRSILFGPRIRLDSSDLSSLKAMSCFLHPSTAATGTHAR